jgi:hypothetical protein
MKARVSLEKKGASMRRPRGKVVHGVVEISAESLTQGMGAAVCRANTVGPRVSRTPSGTVELTDAAKHRSS